MMQWPRIGFHAQKQIRGNRKNIDALLLKTNDNPLAIHVGKNYPFENTMTSPTLPEDPMDLQTMFPGDVPWVSPLPY